MITNYLELCEGVWVCVSNCVWYKFDGRFHSLLSSNTIKHIMCAPTFFFGCCIRMVVTVHFSHSFHICSGCNCCCCRCCCCWFNRSCGMQSFMEKTKKEHNICIIIIIRIFIQNVFSHAHTLAKKWPMWDSACVKIYLVSHFASFWFDIYLYDEHSVCMRKMFSIFAHIAYHLWYNVCVAYIFHGIKE